MDRNFPFVNERLVSPPETTRYIQWLFTMPILCHLPNVHRVY